MENESQNRHIIFVESRSDPDNEVRFHPIIGEEEENFRPRMGILLNGRRSIDPPPLRLPPPTVHSDEELDRIMNERHHTIEDSFRETFSNSNRNDNRNRNRNRYHNYTLISNESGGEEEEDGPRSHLLFGHRHQRRYDQYNNHDHDNINENDDDDDDDDEEEDIDSEEEELRSGGRRALLLNQQEEHHRHDDEEESDSEEEELRSGGRRALLINQQEQDNNNNTNFNMNSNNDSNGSSSSSSNNRSHSVSSNNQNELAVTTSATIEGSSSSTLPAEQAPRRTNIAFVEVEEEEPEGVDQDANANDDNDLIDEIDIAQEVENHHAQRAARNEILQNENFGIHCKYKSEKLMNKTLSWTLNLCLSSLQSRFTFEYEEFLNLLYKYERIRNENIFDQSLFLLKMNIEYYQKRFKSYKRQLIYIISACRNLLIISDDPYYTKFNNVVDENRHVRHHLDEMDDNDVSNTILNPESVASIRNLLDVLSHSFLKIEKYDKDLFAQDNYYISTKILKNESCDSDPQQQNISVYSVPETSLVNNMMNTMKEDKAASKGKEKIIEEDKDSLNHPNSSSPSPPILPSENLMEKKLSPIPLLNISSSSTVSIDVNKGGEDGESVSSNYSSCSSFKNYFGINSSSPSNNNLFLNEEVLLRNAQSNSSNNIKIKMNAKETLPMTTTKSENGKEKKLVSKIQNFPPEILVKIFRYVRIIPKDEKKKKKKSKDKASSESSGSNTSNGSTNKNSTSVGPSFSSSSSSTSLAKDQDTQRNSKSSENNNNGSSSSSSSTPIDPISDSKNDDKTHNNDTHYINDDNNKINDNNNDNDNENNNDYENDYESNYESNYENENDNENDSKSPTNANSYKDVYSCILVCRHWRPLAQKELYHTLSFNYTNIINAYLLFKIAASLEVLCKTEKISPTRTIVLRISHDGNVPDSKEWYDRKGELAFNMILRNCPNLKYLALFGANFSNLTAEVISSVCPNINQLLFIPFSASCISERSLLNITSHCHNIHSLILSFFTFSSKATIKKIFKNLESSLRNLDLIQVSCEEDDFEFIIPYLKNVEELGLMLTTSFTDASLKLINRYCSKLEFINFTGLLNISDQGLGNLFATEKDSSFMNDNLSPSSAHTLDSLFHNRRISGDTSYHHHQHPKNCRVKRINLSDCMDLTDDGLKIISDHCEALEAISIDDCPHISDEGFEAFVRQQTKIKYLSIANSEILSNRSIECLNKYCPDIEKLNIKGCLRLREKTIKKFISLHPKLNTLCFHQERNSFSRAFINYLNTTFSTEDFDDMFLKWNH